MRDRLLAAALLCSLAACGAKEEPAEAPTETHAAEPADASPTLEQVAAEARAAAEAPATAAAPAAEPAPDGASAPAPVADPSGHAEPAPAADAPPAH